jgi:hypothetical protein
MRATPGDRASALARTLHGGLDRLLFFLHYAKAQTAGQGLPLGTRLDLLRHGFLPSSGRLYRSMTPESRGDYLADYPRYCRTPFVNGGYRFCLDDKAVFGGLLQRYPDHAPRTLAAIYRGRLLPVRNAPGEGGASLEGLVAAHAKVVLKPAGGAGGRGVMFVEAAPGGDFLVDGEPRTAAGLRAEVGRLDGHVVEEFVRQHPALERLHPATTNTVRLVTMRDPDSGEPFVAGAVLRIGTGRSRPVDTFARGGLCAAVDLGTGRLGPAMGRTADGSAAPHASHPETGAPVAGVEVPGWRSVTGRILEFCADLHFLSYIGWDLAITEGGFRVIEGNSHPDMQLLQVHGPLLADPRVRRFYEAYGVVRRRPA